MSLMKSAERWIIFSFANFSWLKVMFWSACIYLLIYWFVCMLPTFLKTTGPNCMEFSGMICHYPRTN